MITQGCNNLPWYSVAERVPQAVEQLDFEVLLQDILVLGLRHGGLDHQLQQHASMRRLSAGAANNVLQACARGGVQPHAMCFLFELPAVQHLRPDVVAEVLLSMIRHGSLPRPIRDTDLEALLMLPAVQQLSTQTLQDILAAAAAGGSLQLVMGLLQRLPQVGALLSCQQLLSLLGRGIKEANSGAVQLLCRLPAAQELSPEALVTWLCQAFRHEAAAAAPKEPCRRSFGGRRPPPPCLSCEALLTLLALPAAQQLMPGDVEALLLAMAQATRTAPEIPAAAVASLLALPSSQALDVAAILRVLQAWARSDAYLHEWRSVLSLPAVQAADTAAVVDLVLAAQGTDRLGQATQERLELLLALPAARGMAAAQAKQLLCDAGSRWCKHSFDALMALPAAAALRADPEVAMFAEALLRSDDQQ